MRSALTLCVALLIVATLSPFSAHASSKKHRIELYTTSWCGYCTKARNFFRQKQLPFTEYDVERDRDAARRHRQMNPRGGVPVVVIDGTVIPGYAPEIFDELLER